MERINRKNVSLDNKPMYNSRFKKKFNKRQIYEMILDISENLTLAYRFKEMYLHFNQHATKDNCEIWFDSILSAFKESQLPEYSEFISMLENWKTEILNSFKRTFENRRLSNTLSKISMVKFVHIYLFLTVLLILLDL